jgi:hypothetical protein
MIQEVVLSAMNKDHLQRFTRLASFQDSDQKDSSENEVYWYSFLIQIRNFNKMWKVANM